MRKRFKQFILINITKQFILRRSLNLAIHLCQRAGEVTLHIRARGPSAKGLKTSRGVTKLSNQRNKVNVG